LLVLQLVGDGLANKEIGRKLDITEATVKVHLKGILRKLNLANRTQAAVWYFREMAGPQRESAELGFGLG
jgi:two-component system nitrate/nitrite response regulator NarL